MACEHPGGIDFLIVNAAIVDAEHKSGIETCALSGWLMCSLPGAAGLRVGACCYAAANWGCSFASRFGWTPLCMPSLSARATTRCS